MAAPEPIIRGARSSERPVALLRIRTLSRHWRKGMTSEHHGNTHQQLYESRYKGNYMDTDDYSEWAKKGLQH